jgi:hypothetical protein
MAVTIPHVHCDLPTSPTTTIATFAYDTAVLATDCDPAVASQELQTHVFAIQIWLLTWRMRANTLKSVHVTFTTRSGTCPPVHMNNVQHLDRKLIWIHHIFTEWKHLGVTLTKMYWLLGENHNSL